MPGYIMLQEENPGIAIVVNTVILACAVILGNRRHGGLCTKSAQWSFSHANLALRLTVAFNARAQTEISL